LDSRSKFLRNLAIDALEGGKRGHIGSTMSLVEIFRVLYDDILIYDPNNPKYQLRDRLILSKGHGCIAQYIMLADKKFFPSEDLKTFCKFNSILGGHPELGHVPGIEASTGALGHGLAIGVGIAMACRLRKLPSRIFVVVGDGELNEGSIWESMLAASHHKLTNLTIIIDQNKLQSFGDTKEVLNLEPLFKKFVSFGFDTTVINGHDISELSDVLSKNAHKEKPSAVIAQTVKGKGISFAENQPDWHHKSNLNSTDICAMRDAINNA
jgi:transketolase